MLEHNPDYLTINQIPFPYYPEDREQVLQGGENIKKYLASSLPNKEEQQTFWEYFWGMGYIMVVLFAILQNGAFQHDFIDFFMTPFMWYVRFCKWLVYPTYDNGFNQKIAYTGGEVWVIRILAIVAVLFIVGILIVIPSMSKTICLYFMLPPFPVCIKIT